jgi:hypothetical protein
MTLPPLPEHRGWQWLDTGQFRKALPDAAEPAAWNRLYTANQMRAYATAAVAAERERCARICDDIAKRHLCSGRYTSVVADHSVRAGGQVDGAEECAAAIRGEQK